MTNDFSQCCTDCGLSIHDPRWVDYVADRESPVKINGGEVVCLQCYGGRISKEGRSVFVGAGLSLTRTPLEPTCRVTRGRIEKYKKVLEVLLAVRRETYHSRTLTEGYWAVSMSQKVAFKTLQRWVAQFRDVPDHRLEEAIRQRMVKKARGKDSCFSDAVREILAAIPKATAHQVQQEALRRGGKSRSIRSVQRYIGEFRGKGEASGSREE